MIAVRFLITIIGSYLLIVSANIFAGERTSKEQQAISASPMAQLQAAFKRARSPRQGDLIGTWILVKNTSTEIFLTGREGQDHVISDDKGIRRSNVPNNPLEWKLTFSFEDGRLQATSDTVWEPTGDISVVNFSSDGDMLFEKDYGGDAAYVYRCRASNSQHLVCLLDRNKNGHGIEFKKTSK